MVTIYVDVLIGLNYIINFLLLLGTKKMAGVTCRRWRLVAGALAGALSDMIIFLPPLLPVLSTLYKVGVALVIVGIVFGVRPVKRCLYLWFILFTITFLFAGVTLALYFAIAPAGMMWYNGVVYFHLPPLLLLAAIVAAYLCLLLFERFFSRRLTPDQLYPLCIEYLGGEITLTGLADTGNSLVEPFSNTPVIICGFEDAAQVLPIEYMQWFTGNPVMSPPQSHPPPGYRLVSYCGVGSMGVLPAFKADQMFITVGGKKLRRDAYLALSGEKIGDERYNAVFNPQLVKLGI